MAAAGAGASGEHAVRDAPPRGAAWAVSSEHLDPDAPQKKQLHLIVLNWHLPALTARLWPRGEQPRRCGGAGSEHSRPV